MDCTLSACEKCFVIRTTCSDATARDEGRSIKRGGVILIYSCSTMLISFEIVVFTVCEYEYMNMSPTPTY